jgi:hypothetical protein
MEKCQTGEEATRDQLPAIGKRKGLTGDQ